MDTESLAGTTCRWLSERNQQHAYQLGVEAVWNRRSHELQAILRWAARHRPDELEACVTELKSEPTGRLRWRARTRRSAAVDKALTAITTGPATRHRLLAIIARSTVRTGYVRGGNE